MLLSGVDEQSLVQVLIIMGLSIVMIGLGLLALFLKMFGLVNLDRDKVRQFFSKTRTAPLPVPVPTLQADLAGAGGPSPQEIAAIIAAFHMHRELNLGLEALAAEIRRDPAWSMAHRLNRSAEYQRWSASREGAK